MIKEIWFDMDGTIADLYGVDNWLDSLLASKTKPYREAKPLVNMRTLGKELNRLQANGYKIGVISWLAKNGIEEYGAQVTETKIKCLAKHIGAVQWDSIQIVAYGTPKGELGNGILFDDEKKNREEWRGIAFGVNNIIEVLRGLE